MMARLLRTEVVDVDGSGSVVSLVAYTEFAADGTEAKGDLLEADDLSAQWLMYVWKLTPVAAGCRRRVRHIHREMDVGDLPVWCRDRAGDGARILCSRARGGDRLS